MEFERCKRAGVDGRRSRQFSRAAVGQPSRRGRLAVAILLVLAVTLQFAPTAWAGNGTPGNPWLNEHVFWERPTTPDWIGRVYQDITPTVTYPTSFWSLNPHMNQHGFYIGMQRDGTLHGSQPGDTAPRTVVFSLFGTSNTSTFRRLNTSRCSTGADGGPGVSCSMPWTWANNTSYRVSVDIILSSSSTVCPSSSPNSCLLYIGYIGRTDNPLVRTEIARWSANHNVYGDVTYGDNFVEDFTLPFCDARPRGRFMLPFFRSGAVDYPSPNSFSSDSGQPGECGRSYEIAYGAEIYLVTP